MNRLHRWYCRSEHWRRVLTSGLMPWVLDGIELGGDVLEIGPGPGLTTDLLRQRAERLTSIEIDGRLAAALRSRTRGTNVSVVEGDASAMPFPNASFSAAVSCTMLHHVPSQHLQDRLLAETFRVLRPGGIFVGSDSTPSLLFRAVHWFDTMVLVDPEQFGARLARAGFRNAEVLTGKGAFRFRAQRP